MNIELTDQQRLAIASTGVGPPRMVDPTTNTAYVLLRADLYERLRTILEDFRPSDAYPLIDQAFAPGWNDSKMDDYDRYEELKR